MCKVAILIPTLNRSEFLIRQLEYYASMNSQHPVYVGDGSEQVHHERILKALSKLQNDLTIHYYHWPDLNDQQTIKKLGQMAQEEYCAFIGDDDFFIPNSLTKCADFLKHNPEYRTAQGNGAIFSLNESEPFGSFKGLGPYWYQNEAVADTGVERLLHFGNNYWVPQFSVHRQAEFLDDSLVYGSVEDRSFGELIHSFTFIAKGKSKFVDCLYLVRQVHEARYILPDTFDWLTNPHWWASFQAFSDSLSADLAKVDNIEIRDAQDIVKQVFWAYLLKCLEDKYNHKYRVGHRTPNRPYQKWIKRIPGMTRMAKRLRAYQSRLVWSKDEISLPALSRLASPYYSDFKPLRDFITQE